MARFALAATASLQRPKVRIEYSCIPGWSIFRAEHFRADELDQGGVVCPHESPAELTGNTNNIGTKKTVIACMGGCGLFLFPKERRRIMND